MKIYAIIPARGGSKGVPKKNIRDLAGHPLLAYSIRACQLARGIDRTIVSTDSEEIAEVAKKYKAEVPFLRPAALAQDRSTDLEFMENAIDWFQKNENSLPDLWIHIRPTTPLRDPAMIERAIKTFKEKENEQATALRSVHEMSESAYKCFEIDGVRLKRLGTDHFNLDAANQARQSFPKTYSANGYVDILKTSFIQNEKLLHGNHVIPFITPAVIEVDTEEDFEQLEFQSQKNNPIFRQLFG